MWRILAAMDIGLTKVRGRLNRRDDPTFWAPVRDICGLYQSATEGSSGLAGIEERARSAGGRLWLHTEPGRGTAVLAAFPDA
ncbi:MAG: hypothetical protein ACRD0N_15045 [Acidimicrobiales bacterium]